MIRNDGRSILTSLIVTLSLAVIVAISAPVGLQAAAADGTDTLVEELAQQFAESKGKAEEEVKEEEPPKDEKARKKEEKRKKREARRIEWVAVPIPFANPTIEAGLAPVVLALYKLDKEDEKSPASVTGLGGFYSTNDSWGVVVGQRLFLNEDRWRITAAAGTVDVKYDFFGIGNQLGDRNISIPLRQTGDGFFVQGQRRVPGNVFIGLRFASFLTTVELNRDRPPGPGEPDLVGISLDARIAFLGLRVDRDTRNGHFYPTRGSQTVLNSDFYGETWGSDFDYQNYTLAYNMYRTLTPRQVIAYRAMGCYTGGSPPFFGLCAFGSGADLRGYPRGRYRDNAMFATQAEWRVGLPKRFGAVAFAGFGGIAPSWSDFEGGDLLPSVGVGVRWMVAQKNKINLRVDYAWGDGDQALYVSVGEAF